MIIRRFYLDVDEDSSRYDDVQVVLYVQQIWVYVTEAEANTVKVIYESSHDPKQREDRLNKATAGYLADVAMHEIVLQEFWKTGTSFPIAKAGDVLADFNEKLNRMLSDQIVMAGERAGIPSALAGPISGIMTNYVLDGISGSLEKMSMAFQAIGLAVGLLTAQPTLIVACAKDLEPSVIKLALEQSAEELISQYYHNLAVNLNRALESLETRSVSGLKSHGEIKKAAKPYNSAKGPTALS